MRFVTFTLPDLDAPRPGVLLDDLETIVDLGERFSSLMALIDAGESGLEEARQDVEARRHLIPIAQAQLLAPLPRPRQLRDCLLYEKHLQQAMAAMAKLVGHQGDPPSIAPVWYNQPIYYKANRMTVIGTGADIQWPAYSKLMDFELEIAVVIGRKVRDLTPENAAEAIFGYMIFNDVSARDAQMVEMGGHLGPAKGKDFDTGSVLGPWLVTADEIGDVRRLKVQARLNGEIIADTTAAGMHHDLGHVLSHISASETLYPGEVIALGTIGDCSLIEHGRSLNPDDLIEFEVENLGCLRNRIVKQG